MNITACFGRPRPGLFLSALLLCLPLLAQSQTFPSKPIRLIVPFQAGGGNDLLARIISQKFLEKWGRPVIVDETVPGYEVNAWYGIFAPTGTPAPIVQQLSQELQQIFRQPDIQARRLPLGYEISTANPEKTREILARDLDKWRKVVKAAGIKPE